MPVTDPTGDGGVIGGVAATLIAAGAAGLVYITGYAYLYGFYDHYDVSMAELGLGVEHVAAYAANVYRTLSAEAVSWRPTAAVALRLVAATALGLLLLRETIRGVPIRRMLLRAPGVVIGAVLGAALVLAPFEAERMGRERAERYLGELCRLSFVQSDSARGLASLEERFDLYHLITTRDTHFVLARAPGDTGLSGDWVVRIPKSQILGLRVHRSDLCQQPAD